MIEHYKKNYPDVPTEYWDKASKYVNYNELIEKLIPVYTKHFTEQIIKSFHEFIVGSFFVIKITRYFFLI